MGMGKGLGFRTTFLWTSYYSIEVCDKLGRIVPKVVGIVVLVFIPV